MKSYLIKYTTKEERAELVKKALFITSAGDALPSDDAIKIVKQYIEGEKELEDVQKEIIERKVKK